MGLWEKLREIHFNRRKDWEDAKDAAGREGEGLAAGVVLRLAESRLWYCRKEVRVPKVMEPGKHEIDILLLTERCLFGIEVKNWGGQIDDLGDGRWRQVSSRGDVRWHKDALADLRSKVLAANHYLDRHELLLPREALRLMVVFTNPRVRLDPHLASKPGIVRLQDLTASILRAADPAFAGSGERLPLLRAADQVAGVMNRLPTWDYIQRNGGKILKGDIRTREIRLESGRTVTRVESPFYSVEAPRGYFRGLFRKTELTWTDFAGRRHQDHPLPGQEILISLSGRGEEVAVPIEHVLRVSFGWYDESYYDPPPAEPENYMPGTLVQGLVDGCADFGVFVRIDDRQTGLIHVSKLRRFGKSPRDFPQGASVIVRILGAEKRDGKVRVELDLADTESHAPARGAAMDAVDVSVVCTACDAVVAPEAGKCPLCGSRLAR